MSEQRTPSARARTGLYLGRLAGIRFYLDYSWFVIAAVVTFQLAARLFPENLPGHGDLFYAGLGIAAALLFFASILLHELGHSVVSQRCGIRVPRITLMFIGGLAEISREPDDARSELKIALGGPAVSAGLVFLYALAAWGCWRLGLPAGRTLFLWLAYINAALLFFNAIPGYPLDGGRVLRALLWAKTGNLRKATYVASRFGIAFAWCLMALGFFALTQGRWDAVIYFLIGIFLRNAAESGYLQAVNRAVLTGVRVRDIMTANPAAIPDTLPLNMAVDDFFLAKHHVAFPVRDEEGAFRGLLRLEFLKTIPTEKWPYTSTGNLVAEQGSESLFISASEPASQAMRRLLTPGESRLAVVEGGKLVGIVTRHDILQFIEIHTALE